MRQRQQDFEQGSACFYYLSSDSSFQRGGDFIMTLEDAICAENAGKVFAEGFDTNTFNAANLIETTSLPTSLVGAGNSAVTAKFEALVDCLKLDRGPSNMSVYGRRVISFTADYGTEAKFVDVPWPASEVLIYYPGFPYTAMPLYNVR